jgi:very-short-patch-repair endonuclease/predicted DNA-binding protein
MKKKTTEQFIENAKEVHGDKYDYSKVEYMKSSIKVIITCTKHGNFEQRPNDHLRGNGCPLCAGNNFLKTQEQFVKEAIEKHGDKYDYSKVEYKTTNTKVIIICKNHGNFEQTPCSHLQGQGCKTCGITANVEKNRKTQEQFVKEAIEKHGDKYDYSKVEYKTALDKVLIICKTHGEFNQVAISHLTRSGCPLCAGNNFLKTQEQFVKEAIEKHGDKYDYSKVEYKTTNTKVIIICKIHGNFEQTPCSHLQGQGCLKCCNRYSPTTEEFIVNAVKIHGDLYDYSKVNYTKNKSKIIIICKKHGEFTQKPNGHLCGMGCYKCGKERCADKLRKSQDEFIQEAIEKHGDKYGYSKVEYKSSDTKVIIRCKIHGHFQQTPYSHIIGRGCFTCGRISCGNKLMITTEEFIVNAIKIHGDKYNYSKVDYKGNKCRVIITCKNHGDFSQKPNCHLCGRGCPSCVHKTESKLYEKIQPLYPTIIQQFKQEWCKKISHLPFDFVIPEYKIIIELDGPQHFHQISNWSPPEEQFENDKYKEKCANYNGYSVIRLLQEDVFYDTYDWVKGLCETIEEIKNCDEIANVYLCKNGEYDNY